MSLLPREASYGEQIADYFLAFKGAGLTLSALDAELVLDWQERAVPLSVVCRGIRKAAEARRRTERPSAAGLRSLRACAKWVEAEVRLHQGLSAGRASTAAAALDPAHERLRKAQAALERARRLASPPLRQAIERVLPLARRPVASPSEASAQIAYLDEALALGYLRALPFRERVALGRQLRSELQALLRASPRARRAAWRAHRVMQARMHGHLPALS